MSDEQSPGIQPESITEQGPARIVYTSEEEQPSVVAGSRSTLKVRVRNNTVAPHTGKFYVVADIPQREWLSVSDKRVRIDAGGEITLEIIANIPHSAYESDPELENENQYDYELACYGDAEVPDDPISYSDKLYFEVQPQPPRNWRIPLLIGFGVLALLIGVGAWLVLRPSPTVWIAFSQGDNRPELVTTDAIGNSRAMIGRVEDGVLATPVPLINGIDDPLVGDIAITSGHEFDVAWSPDGCQVAVVVHYPVDFAAFYDDENFTDYALRLRALGLGDSWLNDYLSVTGVVNVSLILDVPEERVHALEDVFSESLIRIAAFEDEQIEAAGAIRRRSLVRIMSNLIQPGELIYHRLLIGTYVGESGEMRYDFRPAVSAIRDENGWLFPAAPVWVESDSGETWLIFEMRDALNPNEANTRYLMAQRWPPEEAALRLHPQTEPEATPSAGMPEVLERDGQTWIVYSGHDGASPLPELGNLNEQLYWLPLVTPTVTPTITLTATQTATSTPTSTPTRDPSAPPATQLPASALSEDTATLPGTPTTDPNSSATPMPTATPALVIDELRQTATATLIPVDVYLDATPLAPNSVNDRQPTVLDRNVLLFVSDRESSQPHLVYQIYQLNLNTGEVERVSPEWENEDVRAEDPVWIPQLNALLFAQRGSNTQDDILYLPRGGEDYVRLSEDARRYFYSPAVLPPGFNPGQCAGS